MEKNRIIWADSLKGLLIILVVLGHAIQIVFAKECFNDHMFNLIYSFHMPAFMAISGYFAFRTKRVSLFTACKRRCLQLLVPYFLWSFISCSIGWSFSWAKMMNLFIYPDSSFWFLWILFIISVLFMLCQRIAEKLNINELLPIVIFSIALLILMVVFEIRLFGFQFLSYYFLFYSLGYCFRRFSCLQINNNTIIIVLFLLWAFLAWFWKMHSLPSWVPEIPYIPSSLVQYTYRGLTALIALLVIFSVFPRLCNGLNKINISLKKLGTISLGLYVVHMILLKYIKDLVVDSLPYISNTLYVVFIFIIELALSILIVELLERNKFTAKLLLGKV